MPNIAAQHEFLNWSKISKYETECFMVKGEDCSHGCVTHRMCFHVLAFILQNNFAFDLFNFLATAFTWYGREVDDGRDHRAQANKDPESEEHDAPGGSGLVRQIAGEPRETRERGKASCREKVRTVRCRSRGYTSAG